MTDNLTPVQRAYCMARIKGKDTVPEMRVRSELHRRGLRFRKHVRELPGNPDIVFPSAKTVVFVDGDFWHGYQFSEWQHSLSDWWRDKIKKNKTRDTFNDKILREMGWEVLRVWQHEIDREFECTIERIVFAVRGAKTG